MCLFLNLAGFGVVLSFLAGEKIVSEELWCSVKLNILALTQSRCSIPTSRTAVFNQLRTFVGAATYISQVVVVAFE